MRSAFEGYLHQGYLGVVRRRGRNSLRRPRRVIISPLMSLQSEHANTSHWRTIIATEPNDLPLGRRVGLIGLSQRRESARASGVKRISCSKLHTKLAFEQQRFYNPHHHPEMPRTLQSFGLRVGHGENYSRIHYDQGCALSVGSSDSGSIGDTF